MTDRWAGSISKSFFNFRVITIEKIQYANYTCEAENKLGEATGHVVLFETVVPICPPACDGYNYLSGGSRVQPYTTNILTLHIIFYYSIVLYFTAISLQMKL